MSPPTATADRRTGGFTAPTRGELIRVARLVLDNCHVELGTRKLFRLVDTFTRKAPRADGALFFQYLASAVQLTADQRAHALADPDVARVIGYADPTGEIATSNVMRHRVT